MLHEVGLIFGYDMYSGVIMVSPQAMLAFLQRPFRDWLYSKTWNGCEVGDWTDSKFHNYVFESTSHYNDEDFYFDPKDAEWLGFRVSLEQKDAEVEFVFTTCRIIGEIRPDLNRISMSLTEKLISAKSIINSALSGIVRSDLKPVNRT